MTEPQPDPIQIEALEWFVRMKDEAVSAKDRLAFETWLSADPTHASAYDRAQILWDRFDIVRPEYERLRKSGSIGRRGLLLGGVATLIAGPTLYIFNRPGLFADYRTDVAERRTFVLPDGSTAELGSDSALSLDFDREKRHLRLYRGQGFFSVASDAARPFVVHAANGTTRALGTQFDVKLDSDLVTVSVIEHSVEVQTPDANAVVIGEGWQTSYGADGIAPPKQADTGAIAAWRRDRIVFEDVPLRRVLAELERYRHGRIVLADSSIGDIPVTAVFDTAHTDNALEVIAETLPIRILNASSYMAVVYRR